MGRSLRPKSFRDCLVRLPSNSCICFGWVGRCVEIQLCWPLTKGAINHLFKNSPSDVCEKQSSWLLCSTRCRLLSSSHPHSTLSRESVPLTWTILQISSTSDMCRVLHLKQPKKANKHFPKPVKSLGSAGRAIWISMLIAYILIYHRRFDSWHFAFALKCWHSWKCRGVCVGGKML